MLSLTFKVPDNRQPMCAAKERHLSFVWMIGMVVSHSFVRTFIRSLAKTKRRNISVSSIISRARSGATCIFYGSQMDQLKPLRPVSSRRIGLYDSADVSVPFGLSHVLVEEKSFQNSSRLPS